ncbi:hypothetical protein [Brevundimonas nasdae]|uniref:hypothetical protein n=1 Tax=Brevundimonas nasdae TaxID=172043 RepID=UPI003F68D896
MSTRLAIVVAACLGLVLFGAWLSRGFWKPALDRAVAAAFDARDQADADQLGRAGDAQTSTNIEAWSDQRQTGRAIVADLERQTREDPDAKSPLAPDRRDRLHDADRRLCALRPGLGGCSTAAPLDADVDPREL